MMYRICFSFLKHVKCSPFHLQSILLYSTKSSKPSSKSSPTPAKPPKSSPHPSPSSKPFQPSKTFQPSKKPLKPQNVKTTLKNEPKIQTVEKQMEDKGFDVTNPEHLKMIEELPFNADVEEEEEEGSLFKCSSN